MKEVFEVGDRVFLVHLQEEAEVSRLSGADMVYVILDDMEIPVYCTDITKNIPEKKEEKKMKVVEKNVVEKETKKEARRSLIPSNSGISLAFQPLSGSAEDCKEFRIVLINDTAYPLSFQYVFFLNNEAVFELDKIALPYDIFLLHEIQRDALNDMPIVELNVRDVKNEHIRENVTQKIKPNNFFNKLAKMPLTGEEAYVYKIASVREKAIEKKESNPKVSFDPDVLKYYMLDSASNKDVDVSMPEAEVDLHIESLTKDHQGMETDEMMHFQLGKFQQALERAIANGSDKLYAIHGVGSGKLKKEIHRMLRTYKQVKSFNNDYSAKYGYGATEIILK